MYSIRRFGVVRTATIVAVFYMLAAALFIVPIMLIVAIASVSGAGGGNAGAAGLIGGLVGGLLVLIVYGALGWVFTAIACLLYNLAAGWVGGIQFQLEAVAPPASPAAWTPTPTTTTSAPTTWNPPPTAPTATTPTAAPWETPPTPPDAPPPAG